MSYNHISPTTKFIFYYNEKLHIFQPLIPKLKLKRPIYHFQKNLVSLERTLNGGLKFMNLLEY